MSAATPNAPLARAGSYREDGVIGVSQSPEQNHPGRGGSVSTSGRGGAGSADRSDILLLRDEARVAPGISASRVDGLYPSASLMPSMQVEALMLRRVPERISAITHARPVHDAAMHPGAVR